VVAAYEGFKPVVMKVLAAHKFCSAWEAL